MRRRHFRVSILLKDHEKVKEMSKRIQKVLTECFLGENSPNPLLKVTYIRQRPWWKFWR